MESVPTRGMATPVSVRKDTRGTTVTQVSATFSEPTPTPLHQMSKLWLVYLRDSTVGNAKCISIFYKSEH